MVVPFTLKVFILGWFDSLECIKNRDILINFIMAASISLAKAWKEGNTPSLHEW